ncbi:MAG: mRNA surveillance protein pelota [Candidatus Hecatellales archaeon]|nr:MAG: mRNA surveillance protein pelota [Candidatus Hecatellales archaeon]
MRVLELDKKKGILGLAVENLDDLWHLYNLIQKNDVVYAKTTREIKVRNGMGKFSEGRRILLTLGLKVEKVFFDRSMNRLRIRGIVIEAPEKYEGIKGSYHTITVQPNSNIKIVKQKILDYHLKRVEDACKKETKPIFVVSIDDEEACIAVVHRFGFNIKFEKKIRLPGKLEVKKRDEAVKKYFSEVLKALEENLKNHTNSVVVLVGPGYIKEEFAKYLKEKLKPTPKIHVGSTSSSGLAGVSEAVRSGLLLNIAKEHRFLRESQLVEEFFAEVASEKGKAAYGLEEVENAAKIGAVKSLMVVDKLLREASDEERLKLEDVIHLVESKGGEVTVLSSEHEAGEKILSLGGVAAILRFRV